jgi:hypothetical protein
MKFLFTHPATWLILGLLGWAIFAAEAHTHAATMDWAVFLNYACLCFSALGLALLITRKMRAAWPKGSRCLHVLLPVAVVFSWGNLDRYETRGKNKEQDLLIDTYTRWGGTQTYRWILFKDAGSMRGPMTASGKPHGEWEHFTGLRVDHVWYWYGQEITEGEWHLRNK